MILIISEEQYYINELIEKEKISFPSESVKYINEDADLDDLILDISSPSLFNQTKLFIFNSPTFLAEKKIKNPKHFELLNSIKTNSNDQFIFVFKGETLANNEFSNFVETNAKVYKVDKVKEKQFPKLIKETIEKNGGTISAIDANYLAQKLNNNLEIVMSEAKKLVLETKNITKEIIDVSIPDYEQDSSFSFVNSLKNNNFVLIYSSYLERKKSGDSIQLLIGQLAQQLILANRVYSLSKEGLNSKQMSLKLSIHLFRVVKAVELVSILTISKVRKLIKGLAKVDYDIKVRGVNDEKAFEFFLIKEFAK